MAEDDADYAKLVAKLPRLGALLQPGRLQVPPRHADGRADPGHSANFCSGSACRRSQSVGGIGGAASFWRPSAGRPREPYWKLRRGGGCQDIFFLTTNAKIPGLVKAMTEAAEAAGYSIGKMGIYLQPIVQGTNCHVEFNLFYDPTRTGRGRTVRGLATSTIQPLMNAGAFFSRPFGEAARQIMNRDAAVVEALKKFKAIVDPAGILNPGKLCF